MEQLSLVSFIFFLWVAYRHSSRLSETSLSIHNLPHFLYQLISWFCALAVEKNAALREQGCLVCADLDSLGHVLKVGSWISWSFKYLGSLHAEFRVACTSLSGLFPQHRCHQHFHLSLVISILTGGGISVPF